MAADLAKVGSKVMSLDVHPSYALTKMMVFDSDDDMETCMGSSLTVIARFATAKGGIFQTKDMYDGMERLCLLSEVDRSAACHQET